MLRHVVGEEEAELGVGDLEELGGVLVDVVATWEKRKRGRVRMRMMNRMEKREAPMSTRVEWATSQMPLTIGRMWVPSKPERMMRAVSFGATEERGETMRRGRRRSTIGCLRVMKIGEESVHAKVKGGDSIALKEHPEEE